MIGAIGGIGLMVLWAKLTDSSGSIKAAGYNDGYKEGFAKALDEQRPFILRTKHKIEELKILYNEEFKILNTAIDHTIEELEKYEKDIDEICQEVNSIKGSRGEVDTEGGGSSGIIGNPIEQMRRRQIYEEAKEKGIIDGRKEALIIAEEYRKKLEVKFNDLVKNYQAREKELEETLKYAQSKLEEHTNPRQVDLTTLRKSVSNYEMGEKYRLGKGVPRNLETAKKFYINAAKLGNAKAIQALEKYFLEVDFIRSIF